KQGARLLRRIGICHGRAGQKPGAAADLSGLRQPAGQWRIRGVGTAAVSAAAGRRTGRIAYHPSRRGRTAMSDTPLALRCPLRGSRLIEASAGTGKTFTISALYLRLVLGHGGDNGFTRELLPPDILVVTFTEAATQELRDRIRARLVQAAQAFRGELQEIDPILQGLLDDIDPAHYASAARKLDIAGQWMDQAAVSTIHSWCQRMLREHAFDSGSLFEQTLETDQSDLLAEVVRDYWREHCYPLQGEALLWVRQHWQQPDELGRLIKPWMSSASAPEEGDLQQLLTRAMQQAASELEQ